MIGSKRFAFAALAMAVLCASAPVVAADQVGPQGDAAEDRAQAPRQGRLADSIRS